MIIERLDIKGFGKFNNLVIRFDKGLNIIYGANESGKSTVEAFIKAMFYSLKGGRTLKEGMLPPLKKYRPWRGSDYKGSMVYALDSGEVYTVERGFADNSVRIYDSLYKDITNTFDQSKEKGPLFAVSHIGLTEACFDKTLFISQMRTTLSIDDSSELLARLSNITETGFEDVSYKRARDAVKDALKNYVGTDKTSTRPLDVINLKLNELNLKKQSLIKERECLFSAEDEITTLNGLIKSLEERKTIIVLAKDIIKVREELDNFKRKKKELSEINAQLSGLNGEISSISYNMEEYRKVKEQFEVFSVFGYEDVDDLSVQYTKLQSLNIENNKISLEIQKLKREAEETEASLEDLKAFNSFEDIEDIITELTHSTDSIELNQENYNNVKLDESIKASLSKGKAIGTGMAGIAVMVAGVMYLGLTVARYLETILGSVLLLALFIAMASLKVKTSKEYKAIKQSKDKSDLKIKKLFEKINIEKDKQTGIFKMLEVKSVEELLKKKAIYDSKVLQLTSLNHRIDELEAAFNSNLITVSELLQSIRKKLKASSIVISIEDGIEKRHIEEFRNGVNKCKEITPGEKHCEEKLSDLESRVSYLYSRVTLVCGQMIDSEEGLTKVICEIDNKINNLYKRLDVFAYKIKAIYQGSDFDGFNYDELMGIILDSGLEEAKKHIEEEFNYVLNRINEVYIAIKEKEMVLKGLTGDDNRMEELDESMREMESRKSQLEDIGFSLRTALEVLEEASTEIKRDFAPVLNSNTSRIVNRITSYKYEELKVDENLIPRTIDPLTKDIVPVSLLSGGTTDQMYLALRIALVQTIEKESERLPLIMDEILAQYDDTRSLETIKLLKELSEERQVLLFTCKSREVELVKSVCNNDLNIIELS